MATSAQEHEAWVKDHLGRMGLTNPKQPQGFGETYDFPDSPEGLSDTRLGQLMLRLSAYQGYATFLLGIVESELAILDASYREGVASYKFTNDLKRVNYEVVEAQVAAVSDEFAALRDRRTRRQALRSRLQAYVQVYQVHYAALSRELARRGMVARLAQ